MLQLNSVANVGVHRTCSPLYEKYEATPYNTFLDPSETGNIYSGMVVYRTGPDTVALFDGSTATSASNSPKLELTPGPYGLVERMLSSLSRLQLLTPLSHTQYLQLVHAYSYTQVQVPQREC